MNNSTNNLVTALVNTFQCHKNTNCNSCFLCTEDEQMIEYIKLTKGEIYEENSKFFKLVFLLKGKLKISSGPLNSKIVDAGSFFFLPANYLCRGVSLINSSFIVFRISEQERLPELFTINECNEAKPKSDFFPSLISSDKIIKFIDLLKDLLDDQFLCRKFMNLKMQELFFLLKRYYTQHELSILFNSTKVRDASFLSLVLHNYDGTQNADQLAALCNQNLSSFTRRFIKNFGVSPYQWLKKQKSEEILCEIRSTNKTFVQIAEDFGFSSLSYFYNFCHREFGTTPGKLRL